ncbi:MAG: hypothetical protein JWP44_4082 [Mucilaginibacter sp.]|nr:hypothetical protein [Mucilaginibacter sp.]
MTLMSLLFKLIYIRYCAHLGSKRLIGSFDSLMLGIFFGIFGIFIILSSRRYDDYKADAALLQKFKQN